jgi:hypothetical protein
VIRVGGGWRYSCNLGKVGLIKIDLTKVTFSQIPMTFARILRSLVVMIAATLLTVLLSFGLPQIGPFSLAAPAWAGLTDDNFDGEIFALYGGNGSIVPPKNGLADTIKQKKAAVLVFYVDDSTDCKKFSLTVSNLQGLYNRVANFIPIRIDSIAVKESYDPTDLGYYYKGYVPQTVIFDPTGKVRLDEAGQVQFEKMDDTMRAIFDLVPRSESTTLKRRQVNEVSTELVK